MPRTEHARRSVLRRLARHRSAAFAALLAWCTGMPFAGQVLCIGESGHVAVEFAGPRDGACAHPEPGAEHADHAWCAEEGCGPCHDEQLGEPGFSTRPGTVREAFDAAAAVLPGVPTLDLRSAIAAPVRDAARPPAPWTRLKPTIVLQV